MTFMENKWITQLHPPSLSHHSNGAITYTKQESTRRGNDGVLLTTKDLKIRDPWGDFQNRPAPGGQVTREVFNDDFGMRSSSSSFGP